MRPLRWKWESRRCGTFWAPCAPLCACDGGPADVTAEVSPTATEPAPPPTGPTDPGEAGAPICAPSCVGLACGDPDGCGDECGPCATPVGCPECALRLEIIEQQVIDGAVRIVTLAIDYDPGPGDALPSLADLRVAVDGPASLLKVAVGPPILDSGKQLFIDPSAGTPWRQLADGTWQLLIFDTASTTPIAGGRWVLMQFVLGEGFDPVTTPVAFSLVRREQTFAPPIADQALWGADVSKPSVVWPWVIDD